MRVKVAFVWNGKGVIPCKKEKRTTKSKLSSRHIQTEKNA